MSFPNVPNVTPLISLSTAQTVPLLLASVALEELAIAHLVNAEAEKLQFVLGTLTPTSTTFSPATVSLSNLLAVDASVQRTLRDVIKKEMLLEFKFENILDLIPILPAANPLTILKTATVVQNAPPLPPIFIIYNITVTNTGTTPLNNLVVVESIPPGTALVTTFAPGFTVVSTPTMVTFFANSPLAPSSSANIQVVVNPQTPGTFINIATASADGVAPVSASTTTTV